MRQYIYIPQGLYGNLRQDGDHSVYGLITDGIQTCCGIAAWREGDLFLCHADAQTDLFNPRYGLIRWARDLPAKETPIEIRYSNDDVDQLPQNHYKGLIDHIVSQLHLRYHIEAHAVAAPSGKKAVLLNRGQSVLERAQYLTSMPTDKSFFTLKDYLPF